MHKDLEELSSIELQQLFIAESEVYLQLLHSKSISEHELEKRKERLLAITALLQEKKLVFPPDIQRPK